MKTSLEQIQNKKNKQKLVCLTAYSFSTAKILDQFCDIILVGDSLGMTVYGFKDTIDVSLEMMINHGKAVTKAAKNAFIVVDLPANSYEKSKEQALESAKKVLKETKCDAIKIEITPNLVKTVQFLSDNNIKVMGHVGLLPQQVRELGGYKYQGKDKESAEEILKTAKSIQKAGAFAIVLEAIPAKLAEEITNSLKIPTIGIGASNKCDGQILVTDDLLGLNQEFSPKFVKKYSNLSEEITKAVANFKKEVQNNQFPTNNHMI